MVLPFVSLAEAVPLPEQHAPILLEGGCDSPPPLCKRTMVWVGACMVMRHGSPCRLGSASSPFRRPFHFPACCPFHVADALSTPLPLPPLPTSLGALVT